MLGFESNMDKPNHWVYNFVGWVSVGFFYRENNSKFKLKK